MRRRSLNPSPSRFERRLTRREQSLAASLREAGLDPVFRGKDLVIDGFRIFLLDGWPPDVGLTWIETASQRNDCADWPCLAWRDGGGWCVVVPLSALDFLVKGPPLRHYAMLNLLAFVALVRGRT